MTISERFRGEGDTRVDEWTRLEAGAQVAKLEALQEQFRRAAWGFADAVKKLNPDFLDRWEIATRRKSMTHAEAIAGFVERIDDQISDLIDWAEVEAQKAIADTGRDER